MFSWHPLPRVPGNPACCEPRVFLSLSDRLPTFSRAQAANTWVRNMGLDPTDILEIYLTSLEWSMQTLTTVGYGNVVATNTTEKLYVILGMVIGAAIFSYVVGTICTLVTGLMVNSVEFQKNMDMLSEYMSIHNFPLELRKRANSFCFYTFEVQKSSSSTQEVVRTMLSLPMQKDVAMHIYGPL